MGVAVGVGVGPERGAVIMVPPFPTAIYCSARVDPNVCPLKNSEVGGDCRVQIVWAWEEEREKNKINAIQKRECLPEILIWEFFRLKVIFEGKRR